MKHIKLFEEFINESFLSNFKDAIKNKDVYHLFKGANAHQNRKKITFDQSKKLLDKSPDLGLNTDTQGKSSWAWKPNTDKTEWYYNGFDGYLYYTNDYEKYI